MTTTVTRQTRGVLEDLVAGRRAAMRPPDDPARLPGLAAREGTSGLLVHALEEGRIALPDDVAAGVRSDWQASRRRTTVLDLELERVARAAPPTLSPPILLKGPAVAERYRDPALRPYVDVDLLVPVAELDAWGTFLGGLGFAGPNEWGRRHSRRYHHHVAHVRETGAGPVPVEVHWCLFVERRARAFTYAQLRPHTEPSRFRGILQPSLPALLLVLGLHLAHHPPETRRLIWLRDFVELASEPAVGRARSLAARHGLGWALEAALADVQDLLGEPRWGARRPREAFGLARTRREDVSPLVHHLALMRELGPVGAAAYAVSRIDPRRFAGRNASLDRGTFRRWTGRLLGRAPRGHARRTG